MPRHLAFSLLLLGLLLAPAAHAQSAELTALRTKAEKGNSIAQYNLGLAYLAGRDAPADWPEAYVWLTLAAENGTTGKALQTLVEQMSPAQLDEGRRRLATARVAVDQIATPAPAPAPDAAKDLSAELALSWKEADALRASLTAAQTARDAAVAELAKLRAEATALGAQNQDLEDAAALRGRTLDETRAKLEAAESRLAELTRGQAQLQHALAAAQADAAKLRDATTAPAKTELAALAELRETLRATRDEANVAQTQLAQQQSLVEQQQGQLVKLRNELEQSQTRLTAARTPDPQATAALNALTEQNTTLKQQLDDAYADTSRQVANLTAELGASRVQLARLQNENQTLNAKLVATPAKDPAEAAALTSTQSALTAAQAELTRTQAARADLESRAHSLATEMDSLKARLADTEARLATTKKPTAPAPDPTVMADLQARLDTALGSYSRLQSENDTLRAAAAQFEAKSSALESELAAAHAATPAPVEAAATANSDLQDKLNTALTSYRLLQDENDALRQNVGQLTERVNALDAQLAAANSGSAGLTAQLDRVSATAAQVDGLREQLRQTNDQLNQANLENERYRTRLAIAAPVSTTTYSAPTRPGTIAATNIAQPRPAASQPPAITPATTRTHSVVFGDTLSALALRYYGNPVRWAEIYEANREQLPNERALRVGMELAIP
ncbi:MAG: LysM peptidoglycan-binding domain-containing protein [Opitutaceae bacterium]|nr:LysM peptidoglycan-binding domain-containing protein [Opitutaceae bacterium]